MNSNKRSLLEKETYRNYMLLMFRYGLREIWTDQYRLKVLVLYLLTALLFSIIRPWDLAYSGPDIFDAASRIAFSLCFPILVFGGLAVLIMWAGTPSRAKSIQNNLQRIGLVNHAGEVPLLVAVRQDETDDAHGKITVLEFLACGVPKSVWEQKSADIETALNVHVAYIQECDGKRRIRLFTVPAKSGLPKMLRWKDEYLQSDFPSCRLVLGESLLGTVSLDLNLIPHVLLGGGTGSGKSVLLKLIWPQLAQTPKLQANPRPRRFDSLLDSVSEKLKQRKDLLGKAGCTNTYEYHRRETLPMDCIVFAVEDSVQHGRERPDSARRPRPFPHG